MGRPRVLPTESYDYWIGLGPDRTLTAVATKYGVHDRTVAKRSATEDWPGRLTIIERKARDKLDKAHVETIHDINIRHLRDLREVQNKAGDAIRKYTIRNAMDAVRALEMAIKLERLIVGEPTDRHGVSIEDTVRHEYERWMTVDATADERVEVQRRIDDAGDGSTTPTTPAAPALPYDSGTAEV